MNESTIQEDSADNEEANQRPVVVGIIAAVMFLNGILTIVNGLMFEAGPVVLASGTVALLLSLGLWQLWSWAWIGTILLQLIAIGVAFYDWFTDGPIDFLAIAIGVIIILYLLRSEMPATFFS